MRSTPCASAFSTCLGSPIMFITRMPAAWNFSTAHVGGTPIAPVTVYDAHKRHTESTTADEQPRLLLDDDVDQLREMAAGVILVRLPRRPPDLRPREVDPERRLARPRVLSSRRSFSIAISFRSMSAVGRGAEHTPRCPLASHARAAGVTRGSGGGTVVTSVQRSPKPSWCVPQRAGPHSRPPDRFHRQPADGAQSAGIRHCGGEAMVRAGRCAKKRKLMPLNWPAIPVPGHNFRTHFARRTPRPPALDAAAARSWCATPNIPGERVRAWHVIACVRVHGTHLCVCVCMACVRGHGTCMRVHDVCARVHGGGVGWRVVGLQRRGACAFGLGANSHNSDSNSSVAVGALGVWRRVTSVLSCSIGIAQDSWVRGVYTTTEITRLPKSAI
eukprot:gene38028-biopygen108645